MDLITAVLAASIAVFVSTIGLRYNAQQSLYLAQSERLIKTYSALLSAAWVMQDASSSEAWKLEKLEDWQSRTLIAGDLARAHLKMEPNGAPQIKDVEACYLAIRKAFSSWRLVQSPPRCEKSASVKGGYTDTPGDAEQKRKYHSDIVCGAENLTAMCNAHISLLQTSIPPWWKFWAIPTAYVKRSSKNQPSE